MRKHVFELLPIDFAARGDAELALSSLVEAAEIDAILLSLGKTGFSSSTTSSRKPAPPRAPPGPPPARYGPLFDAVI